MKHAMVPVKHMVGAGSEHDRSTWDELNGSEIDETNFKGGVQAGAESEEAPQQKGRRGTGEGVSPK